MTAGSGRARFRPVPREQRVEILAEMVANVINVGVDVGDAVDVGDIVVLLESMKMEIPVMAETAGTVTAVKVAEGDVVQEGDPLVELTA
jgi:biotin carboxyl carrier protein